MSKRLDRVLSLAIRQDVKQGNQDLHKKFTACLEGGMHGIGFSPYQEGQQPGDQLEEDQITRRMKIIAPYTKWVRSFSCTDGNEMIPKVAHELGMKTLVGAWLGEDLEKNEEEIDGLIQTAKRGHVDIAAVGNEVMYRGDLTEQQLLDYIERVKAAIPDVQVGYDFGQLLSFLGGMSFRLLVVVYERHVQTNTSSCSR